MKHLITFGLTLAATCVMAAPSVKEPAFFGGEYVHSISSNGKWMVSEMETESSMKIRNLESGQEWSYLSDGLDDGVNYTLATTSDISNDGTAIAEVKGIPSYWRDGKWTQLPGTSGVSAAILGGITPDGSVIAGSLSRGGNRSTKPCIWHRQADGTFGMPEFLGEPVPHLFANGAMYANATAISDDGKVVGVCVNSGNGMNRIPYVYILGTDGQWTNKALGENLINPLGIEIPRQSGGGANWTFPDYEAYMTQEQQDAFYAASPMWVDDQYAAGLDEEEIILQSYLWAMEFMDEDKREAYRPIAEAFVDAYRKWSQNHKAYEDAINVIADSGVNFEFNNVFVSPDGKYLYATAYRSIVEDPSNPEFGFSSPHAPVRFDVATGEGVAFDFADNVIMSGVTADYSVIGQNFDMDGYFYRQSYIYKPGETKATPIQEHFKNLGNMDLYNWLEENLYREVAIGVNASGADIVDDRWALGKPVATPDFRLLAIGLSTVYWMLPPESNTNLLTVLVDTAMKSDEEVQTPVSSVPSQVFNGESIFCFSPNGKWMVSELDTEMSLIFRDLDSNKEWKYTWDGTDFGINYPSAKGRCISDNGTFVAERGDIPCYWENGKWTELKGYSFNDLGQITAIVGGISADGSIICGGLSKGGSMFDDDNELQMTYPCIWIRQPDGSFGDPEWLPIPGVDMFGLVPQYLHCNDISLDGNTIGAIMRCWSGGWHQLYSYTRDDDGNWQYKTLGDELINPRGMEIMKFPGEYNGPMYPDYEQYMTADQLYDFYYISGPQWIDSLYDQGITDENEIALLELSYAAEFMDDDKRAEYEALLNEFLTQYVPWIKAFNEYMDWLDKFSVGSANFTFNNVVVSPDGKYIYGSMNSGASTIVRFDARTGEYKLYRNRVGLKPTCVTADYSILAWDADQDVDWPRSAYIIPQGEGDAMEIHRYWLSQEREDLYNWMEEHMYQSVVISTTASGAEIFDDRWSVGKPCATPDMTLMGFGGSTVYWETAPKGGGRFITHIMNTGRTPSGIDSIESDEDIFENFNTEDMLDSESAPVYYDLQGVRVQNPTRGIYIRVSGGKSEKVVF